MVIGICVGQDDLRMGLLQHVFQAAKYQTPIQAELSCVSRYDVLVALGNSHNLNVRPMQRVLKEALDMPVNHARDGDTKRLSPCCGLRIGTIY